MKSELINIVKILGIGLTEIVLEIDLGQFTINSIEFRSPDKIILHSFSFGDFDWEVDFDDMDEYYQKYVFRLLSILVYN